jgi:hypothetical protein
VRKSEKAVLEGEDGEVELQSNRSAFCHIATRDVLLDLL